MSYNNATRQLNGQNSHNCDTFQTPNIIRSVLKFWQSIFNQLWWQGVVAAAHTFASTTLLQLLVEDRDLIGHLKSVKKYFLIEQGDFIVQFLDLCDSELSQPVDCVEPAR